MSPKQTQIILSKAKTQTQRAILRRILDSEGSMVLQDLTHYLRQKGYSRGDLDRTFEALVEAELIYIDGMLIRLAF